MFYLPSLSISDEHFKQEVDGELKPINTYSLDGAYFLTKDGSFKYISLDYLYGLRWKNQVVDFDVELGNEKEPINVKIEKVDWKTSIRDNKAYVKVIVKGKLNYNHSSLHALEVEKKLASLIKEDILTTYTHTYKDIDIYFLNDIAYRYKQKLKNDSQFDLTIDASVINSIYEY